MTQINGYKEELQDELQKTDPNSHASRLLAQEIERLEKGDDRKESRSVAFIDVHPNQPQNVGLRVRIPVREFPRFNFVGKLLGPKGNTLKRLQEETGCKMAVLGKGSMRDKMKEEEMRKEGGKKYAHLNEELHVLVEAFAEATDGYRRLSHAVSELKKFLVPTSPSELDEDEPQVVSKVSALDEPLYSPALALFVPQDQPLSVPGTSRHSQQPKDQASLFGLQVLQSIITLTSRKKRPLSSAGPLDSPSGAVPSGSSAPPRGLMAPSTGSAALSRGHRPVVPPRRPTTRFMTPLKGPATGPAVPPRRPVTGSMVQPRGRMVPPTGPTPPRGPMVPPRGLNAPLTGPVISPRGLAIPPGGPVVPSRGPIVPPGGPVVPPRGPVVPHGGQVLPPRGQMISQRGLLMRSDCLPSPFPDFSFKKLKKVHPKPKRKPTPWYSSIREEFHLLKRLRRRAERKWLKSRKAEDRLAFVEAKRKFSRLIEKAKSALEPPKELKKKTDETTKDSEIIDEKTETDDVKVETETCEDLDKMLDNENVSGNDFSQDSSDDGTEETEGINTTLENVVQTEFCIDDMMKGIESMHKNEERIPLSDTEDTCKNPLNQDANDDIRQQQLQEMMYMGGGDAPRGGRGGYRGGPAGRGGPPTGRGAPMRGGGGAPGHSAPGRGGGGGGAPPPRGGGAPPARGAPRGRGGGAAPPPAQTSSYDDYGYGNSSRSGGYDDGYSSRGYGESSYEDAQGDSQYYGSSGYNSRGQSSSAGYDDYGGYDYGDSWSTGGSSGGPMKSSSRGGVSKARAHPYGGY